MKYLAKATSLLNPRIELKTETIDIEDAIGRIVPGEENGEILTASSVAMKLLNDVEQIEVLEAPVIGIAFFGQTESFGDSLVTTLVAQLMNMGCEPAVFEASAEDIESVVQMIADDELHGLITLGGDLDEILELVRVAKGKILFGGVSATNLDAVGGCLVEGKPLLILPEEPIAAMTGFNVLMPNIVNKFYSLPDMLPIRAELICSEPFGSDTQLELLTPAKLRWKNGIPQIRPIQLDDKMEALALADGLMLQYPDSPTLSPHDIVDFISFGDCR